jgi:uncharacterized Zn finger protein (UPF0148 family)
MFLNRRLDIYIQGPKMVEAYCVKCRSKREIQNPQEITLKNGRKAIKGVCPVCGTTLYRILGK